MELGVTQDFWGRDIHWVDDGYGSAAGELRWFKPPNGATFSVCDDGVLYLREPVLIRDGGSYGLGPDEVASFSRRYHGDASYRLSELLAEVPNAAIPYMEALLPDGVAFDGTTSRTPFQWVPSPEFMPEDARDVRFVAWDRAIMRFSEPYAGSVPSGTFRPDEGPRQG